MMAGGGWLGLAGAELSKRMTMAYRMRQEICRCAAVLEAAVRVQYALYMRYNAPSPGHEAQMGRGNVGRRSKREQQCGAASGAPLQAGAAVRRREWAPL